MSYGSIGDSFATAMQQRQNAEADRWCREAASPPAPGSASQSPPSGSRESSPPGAADIVPDVTPVAHAKRSDSVGSAPRQGAHSLPQRPPLSTSCSQAPTRNWRLGCAPPAIAAAAALHSCIPAAMPPRASPLHQPCVAVPAGAANSTLRTALGDKGYLAVRTVLCKQQAQFTSQLFELHKLCQLQKIIFSELQVLDPEGLARVDQVYRTLSVAPTCAPASSAAVLPATRLDVPTSRQSSAGVSAFAFSAAAPSSRAVLLRPIARKVSASLPAISDASQGAASSLPQSHQQDVPRARLAEQLSRDLQLLLNVPRTVRAQAGPPRGLNAAVLALCVRASSTAAAGADRVLRPIATSRSSAPARALGPPPQQQQYQGQMLPPPVPQWYNVHTGLRAAPQSMAPPPPLAVVRPALHASLAVPAALSAVSPSSQMDPHAAWFNKHIHGQGLPARKPWTGPSGDAGVPPTSASSQDCKPGVKRWWQDTMALLGHVEGPSPAAETSRSQGTLGSVGYRNHSGLWSGEGRLPHKKRKDVSYTSGASYDSQPVSDVCNNSAGTGGKKEPPPPPAADKDGLARDCKAGFVNTQEPSCSKAAEGLEAKKASAAAAYKAAATPAVVVVPHRNVRHVIHQSPVGSNRSQSSSGSGSKGKSGAANARVSNAGSVGSRRDGRAGGSYEDGTKAGAFLQKILKPDGWSRSLEKIRPRDVADILMSLSSG